MHIVTPVTIILPYFLKNVLTALMLYFLNGAVKKNYHVV